MAHGYEEPKQNIRRSVLVASVVFRCPYAVCMSSIFAFERFERTSNANIKIQIYARQSGFLSGS